MTEELLDLLAARSGVVCAVGAGGKKTTLYRLAGGHPGHVGVTSTVQTSHFPGTLNAHTVIAEPESLERAVLEAATTHRLVAFAQPSGKRARYAGPDPETVMAIHRKAGFDVTFVKADGARSRWIKAPGDNEPPIPGGATTVIAVVSAKAFGATLSDEIAHRVDQLARVSGARHDEPLSPEHVARLFADEQGALKSVGRAEVVPLINMVDDRDREADAREAAEAALSLTRRFDRVILASMRRPNPVVAVIVR